MVEAADAEAVFEATCQLYPSRVSRVLDFDGDSCRVVFTSHRVAPVRSYRKLLAALGQCRAELNAISSSGYHGLCDALRLAAVDVFASVLAYSHAMDLWLLVSPFPMRTVGMMSNFFVRLETCLLLHLGTSSWPYVSRVVSSRVSSSLISLQHRHAALADLATASSTAIEAYALNIWGHLNLREIDDFSEAVRLFI